MRMFFSLLAAPLLISCDAVLGPREELVVGTVAFYDDPVVIEVPDTVAASVPFMVKVRTYGGGCERLGPTEATVDMLTALVIPYDYTIVDDDGVCTSILKMFSHEVLLQLGVVGEAALTIRGKEEPGGGWFQSQRTVWVR